MRYPPVRPALRLALAAAALSLGLAVAGCGDSSRRSSASATAPATSSATAAAAASQKGGNGAPSGAHYTLNLIGMGQGKTASMTGNSGHRIFVNLVGKTRIQLTEGVDFAVLDANGTDGTASFSLPNPDPDGDGTTEYSVFARALGKPGGSATLTPAAVDPVTGDVYYSVYNVVAVREKGGPRFANVSAELLYVYADIDGDGALDRLPLFDDRLQGYFWEYDGAGLRVVQLRFYPVPTTVQTP